MIDIGPAGSTIPGTGAVNLGKAEDAVHATGDTGIMAMGTRLDTLATISSATGDYEPYHVNANGAVWVAQVPALNGGLTQSRLISAATTNATVVKASAGQVYSIYVNNINAAVRYLKLYNKATAPTVGTDTPVGTLAIPPAGALAFDIGAGWAFATGIGFALTTGIADADTAAVAASEHSVVILYK